MALPKYDKSKRKQSFQQLPKGAYVIRIMAAKEEPNRDNSGTHLTITFDIAEGEYAGLYQNIFNGYSSEDRKWPSDAKYYLSIPGDNAPEYVWTNYNSFFADPEDSNNGYIFSGDPATLKGKVIGGKFYIEQTEYRGQIYDHTRLKWTCVADDVRHGRAGRLPNDKLLGASSSQPKTDADGFMTIPEATEDEIPF